MTDLLQILAAGIGTVAFGALFGVPSKYYPYCGLIGRPAGRSMFFCGCGRAFGRKRSLSFLATVLVILMSRFFCCAGALPGDDFF